ncbi:hypothetical protein LA080_007216 [Diaporthe eres]|nr:hypothetical protein LA080_007216 [Diaporthe eres]
MSPEDLGCQLNAAFLNNIVNHTLAQLDQVVRDREEQTPEVEFDKEHPPHSFKFECKQISAWFQNEEIDTLRMAIQDNNYWTLEARVLLEVLTQKLYSGLADYHRQVVKLAKCMAEKLDIEEMDAVYEKMTRMGQDTDGAIARLEARMETEWASRTDRTATQWQEAIRLLQQIAEASGLDVQKTRQKITDEQYWQREVEALKPYKYQQQYKQQSTRRRPLTKPGVSAQSTKALNARMHSSPRDRSQRNEPAAKVVKGRSSTLKPKKPKPCEQRRSARLRQLAERKS